MIIVLFSDSSHLSLKSCHALASALLATPAFLCGRHTYTLCTDHAVLLEMLSALGNCLLISLIPSVFRSTKQELRLAWLLWPGNHTYRLQQFLPFASQA